MKQIISLLAILFFANVTHAQVISLPKKIMPLKREMVNRTTGHKGYENIKITVELTNTDGIGETLKFKSNTDIDKVEISFPGANVGKQTTNYNANTKDGFFYLESGAYKPGQAKGYLFYFYIKRFDKPIWVCALTEKK